MPRKSQVAFLGVPWAQGGPQHPYPSRHPRPQHGDQGISGPSWRLSAGIIISSKEKKEDQRRLRSPQNDPLPPDNSSNPASQCPLLAHYRGVWLALGADPWVVSATTHGYHLQFSCRPPVMSSATFTTVNDPQHAKVLHPFGQSSHKGGQSRP